MKHKKGTILPFEIHIAKRDRISGGKRWMIYLLSILAALLLCAVITILITRMNPAKVIKEI